MRTAEPPPLTVGAAGPGQPARKRPRRSESTKIICSVRSRIGTRQRPYSSVLSKHVGPQLSGADKNRLDHEITVPPVIAHSITLSLAALDVVVIPSEIVEPAIAASIVFVRICG